MAEEQKKRKIKETFNPVKEDKDGVVAKRMIWSTATFEAAIKGLTEGKKLVANPFYEGNTKLLKGDLVYSRTEAEIEEWDRCRNDITYFAEKHCQLMTPQGIQHVQLREYQVNYLKHLMDNRLSIYLACRQCGKCISFLQHVDIQIDFELIKNHPNRLKKYFDKNYYIKEKDCYHLPLFELYNIYDNSFKWKIQYSLYKFLYKYDGPTKYIYHILERLNTESDEKLLKTFQLEGVKVANENGWTVATHLHQTKPFEVYRLELENGIILDCADEHIVFIDGYKEKWVKDLTTDDLVITNQGLSKVLRVSKTTIKVNMCDLTVDNERHSYYTNDILSHNTTTSAVFMLHYILFNTDKNALVIGSKLKVAKEILDKVKKIYYELPYFLKPGIYKWNECEIVLDNGCRLMAEATTINSGISYTFHCILSDEFAHIQPNILDKFYNNLFPTITAANARFMITSTQNGYNLFYRLYMAAVSGENEYAPFKTDWWEVPNWNPETKQWEPRDENWHKRQVANYGSEEAFNKQFGTNFDVSANTLITQKIISKNREKTLNFEYKDLLGVPYADRFRWHPTYDPMQQLKNDSIIITVDLAEGVGGDYITYCFNRLVDPGSGRIECIGMFRANDLRREDCTLALAMICCYYCDFNNLLISFELNTYGEIFKRQLYDYIENNPIVSQKFDPSVLVKYYTNEKQTSYTTGIKMTPGNKTAFCIMFKESYEKGLITNNSNIFMFELEKFCDDGTNHYKASYGHDDMVMCMVQLECVKSTLQYKFLKDAFDTAGPSRQDELYYNPFDDSQLDTGAYNSNLFDIEQPFDSNASRFSKFLQ